MANASSDTPQTPPTEFPWTRAQAGEYARGMSRTVEGKGPLLTRVLMAAFLFVLRRLSWESADKFGTGIGKLMALLRIRKDVAMTNLDIAFGDTRTRAEKEQIYRNSMITLGRHALDYGRVAQMDDAFWERFEFEGEELLKNAYNRGKGVVFTGGHIGVWEIAAGRAGMAGYPISIVAKRMHNAYVDKMIVDARLAMNLGTVPHRDSMQRVMEGLRRGEGVILAIDQNMKRSQGVFIEWMGKTASTVRSNAWVVRETGAPVVAGYAYRVAPGRFKLVVTEEIPWEPVPDDPDRELLVNTQNQARAVEKIIYEKPELWLWIHRRWKVQPKGEPSPYA